MILIKNIRIDTEKSEKLFDIFIAGKKIQAVGTNIDPTIPSVKVIEGNGRIAVPAYIDQHVHILGGGGENGFASRVPEIQLSEFVGAGVATVVGLLGTDSLTRSVENLVAKTKALRGEGMTAFCLTGAYEYPSPTLTGSVKKDIAFIDEVIGAKIAIADHRSSNMSKRDLIRLASEARLGGMISAKSGVVHMHVGSGKRGLGLIFDILETEDLPISVFRPTHVGRVFDEAVRFANMGGYIDFTADESDSTAKMIAKAFEQAPVDRVTLSSDSNGSIPKWNDEKQLIGMGVGSISSLHATVKSLVLDCGVPLSMAIRPCTTTVAEALGLSHRKGKIAVGYDADLNLLDDALNLSTVIVGGTIMKDSGQILKKGMFEE